MEPKRPLTETISTKVTAEEWKQLEQLWTAAGMTRSEFCRKALLDQLNHSDGNPPSEVTLLLAEVLAFRTVTLNLLRLLSRGEPISEERIRNLADLADRAKLRRASDRLEQFSKK